MNDLRTGYASYQPHMYGGGCGGGFRAGDGWGHGLINKS